MQTADEKTKVFRVANALNTLADEYDAQGSVSVAIMLRKLAGFPPEDLSTLYDLINRNDTAASAAAEIVA